MKYLLLNFILNIFIGSHNAALIPLKPSEDYPNVLDVDVTNQNQYLLLWKLINQDEIQFEAHVKTTGWIGFGISRNFSMIGADIAMGWVKNGVAELKDAYAIRNTRPIEDAVQDFVLIDAAEMDGYTIIKFKRKFITGDTINDIDITPGPHFAIFAWHQNDPNTGIIDAPYHTTTQRYNKTVTFRPKVETLVPSEDYTHKLIVDEENPNQFVLFWKMINDDEIQFEAHCKSNGWVGMGISSNGGMEGADFAIGWVKDGVAVIKDSYGIGNSRPIEDAQQDWVLLEGKEINDYTILKFKRKFETCDLIYDKVITVGSHYAIFAWNNADPITGVTDALYHGPRQRFTHNVVFRDYKNESVAEQDTLPSDYTTFNVTVNNLSIPKKDTYYHCQLFKLPPFEAKEHLIQFEMLVNPKNKRNVHHSLVFECDDGYVPSVFPYEHECGSVKLSNEVQTKCHVKMMVAWGIGGKYTYMFPSKLGYPMEKSSQEKYLLLEMHYDNPEMFDNIVDDSGVRIYFTRQLREFDLGLMTIGTGLDASNVQMPPKTESITFNTICHPECTKQIIPAEGVYIIAGFLHTHLLGKKVTTSLVRDGVQIKKLFDNPNYNFDYQFIMDIEPTKFYPGDSLITSCKFSSMNRDEFTSWGHSTSDEMCFNFMYYYPKQPLGSECLSVFPLAELLKFYSSLIRDGLAPKNLLPSNATQIDFRPYVINYLHNNLTFTDAIRNRFKSFFESSHNKTYLCSSSLQPLLNQLDFSPSKVIEEESRCKIQPNSSPSLNNSMKFITLIFALSASILSTGL